MSLETLKSYDREHSLTFLGAYVFHCHHYNLFHDQTIDDALCDTVGLEVRTRAAKDAFRAVLESISAAEHATTPVERVQLARELFPYMGIGAIEIAASAFEGSARSASLHYGYAWREKYGSRVKRSLPVDAVTAGFLAALTEVAYALPQGTAWAVEEECVAAKATECRFRIERKPVGGWNEPVPVVVDEATVRRHVAPPERGLDEDRIARIGAGLTDFMKAVRGDERGLVQAFSVFVAAQLASYYNESMFEMVTRLEAQSPKLAPTAEELAREAGRVCVFNTFGNVLLSNGKTVQVRINDRGPYVAGRMLDLSHAAGRELGMVAAGTTGVQIDVIGDHRPVAQIPSTKIPAVSGMVLNTDMRAVRQHRRPEEGVERPAVPVRMLPQEALYVRRERRIGSMLAADHTAHNTVPVLILS